MKYKNFEIFKHKYIEDRHPQYNYLSFTAIYNKKYLYVVFRDIDMRLSTEEQLLTVFKNSIDDFIIRNNIQINEDTEETRNDMCRKQSNPV